MVGMKSYCNLTNEQLAYLAGLIDADGCFQIAGNGNPRCLRPNIQVIMTHEPTIRWMAELWGASCTSWAEHRRAEHHKPQFRTVLTGERAADLCQLLLPFMITKKEQAKLIIEFVEHAQTRPGVRLTDEMVAKRIELKQRMNELNDDRRVHLTKNAQLC